MPSIIKFLLTVAVMARAYPAVLVLCCVKPLSSKGLLYFFFFLKNKTLSGKMKEIFRLSSTALPEYLLLLLPQ